MLARRRGWLAAAAIGAAAVSVFACSVIVESRSQQCTTNADCASFGSDAACDPASHACVSKRALLCEQNGCLCDAGTAADIPKLCTNAESHCFDDGTRLPANRPTSAPTDDPPAVDVVDASLCGGGGGGVGGAAGGAGGGTANGGSGGTDPTKTICEELLPKPIYLIGPESLKPLLAWVAKFYANDVATVVYQSESSCTAVDKAFGGGQSTDRNGAFMEPNQPLYTKYFDGAGTEQSCIIQKKNIPPDVYLSDVFEETCGYNKNGTDHSVVDQFGPVQAFGFAVPKKSKQESISHDAAFLVYGFGDKSGVSPWNERKYIYERSPTSGTQALVATLLGIGATHMRATPTASSLDEAAVIGCSKEPEKTIGILAADIVEENAGLKLLAYQSVGQPCGFLPDSTRGANDKANVRDGHYFIWGPIHMLTLRGETKTSVKNLMNYVSGTIPQPASENKNDDIFTHWADAHLVPQCAMRVQRAADAGPLTPFMPDTPCSCEYEAATAKSGKSTCKPCGGSGDAACKTLCTPFGCEPDPP